MSATTTTDVCIVGAGPTGLVAAVLLGQRGHRVTVLERQPAPYPLPRAVHYDAEVGRIFQSCGIGDGVRAISEAADVYEWRNAAGTTLLRFGSVGLTPLGWPASSMFNQPAFEALLEARARSLPTVEIRRGVEVDLVDPHDDHVVVGTAGGDDVVARYVIGADGARSTVRGLAGIEMVDLGYFYDWFVIDVIPNEHRVYDPINLQVCDPARPTTAVSGGPGRRRWEFMRLPDEDPETFCTEAHAWELLAPWDITPDNARIERFADYRFHARWAERWRTGRVFLAGDAAHQTPPFAGQGMCAGVRDAANLTWKLDLVLRGLVGESLLSLYDRERIGPARQVIEFAMALGKVICVPDPEEAAARDAAMSAGVTDELKPVAGMPGLTEGCIAVDTPAAGALCVQGTVDGRPLDDVHGAGWRLLTLSSDVLPGDTLDWFTSIGGVVVPLTAPDDAQARWFGTHGVTWVLQRPDFVVYGTAASTPDADRLVHRLRADLGAAPEGNTP